MSNEFDELLENAIYKENAAEALYTASQRQTQDSGAISLLRELAAEEAKHAASLKSLFGKKAAGAAPRDTVRDLRISDYFTIGESPEAAGLQETLIFAMKQEQRSLEFYSRLMGLLTDRGAKRLCQKLVQVELGHKMKLEILYDDLFYKEN
jgi:rubrerythrin